MKEGHFLYSLKIKTFHTLCSAYPYVPEQFKCAKVVPLHKKDDVLRKDNFRRVSILTTLSKIVEGIMCDQLMSFPETRLSPFVCAYRPGYSCNNMLLKCVEEWKLALDKGETVGYILMDLSKAFDSIPHGLLIAKLYVYGMSVQSSNYILDRKQRVKIGSHRSEWLTVLRGVPTTRFFSWASSIQHFYK